MSELFDKSCYTSRSSGYKYRTLSTNTGQRRRRDTSAENVVDWKFMDLKRAITSRIDKEIHQTQKAREAIKKKFEQVDAKINMMVALQNTVAGLRKDLTSAENTLQTLAEKVDQLVTDVEPSDTYSVHSKSSPTRLTAFNEPKAFSSTVTHI